MAPTAPDTLMCYPLNEEDPFVISELPHVFFAGDQQRFETSYIEGYAHTFVHIQESVQSMPVFALPYN